jgi:pentapeptide MXKDX repeat protein
MKKLSVHLTLLCLLAFLLIPFAGCKKDEGAGDATPATTDTTMTTDTMTTEPMTTDTMGTDTMGTDMMTSEPMTTEATPPAGQ